MGRWRSRLFESPAIWSCTFASEPGQSSVGTSDEVADFTLLRFLGTDLPHATSTLSVRTDFESLCNLTCVSPSTLHVDNETMSVPSKLRAAILIISETASRDPATDKGIPAIQEVFSRIAGDRWDASETRIVPDNVLDIQRAITGWCDGAEPSNLVVTSGGTGFTVKDITPEVSLPERS